MTPREVVENLRLLNRWRRGEDESLPMPEPSDVGCWIDAAADAMEAVGQLRQRAELEEKAERYRLTTLRQDARVAELEAEIERWRVATAKLRDGAEEAGRVANEQVARAEARVKEMETERNSARSQAVSARDSLNREMSESTQRARHYGVEIAALSAANAELAGALREMVDAQDATVEQFTATEIDRLEKAMRVSREVLARHAAGEPTQEACGGRCGDPYCNLSTEGELMRAPAKHPDTERLLLALTDIATAKGLGFPDDESECEYMRQVAESAIDAARKEASS